MKMVEVLVSNLSGEALDYCVSEIEGESPQYFTAAGVWGVASYEDDNFMVTEIDRIPQYSKSWLFCGPLINKYRVSVIYSDESCSPCAWTDDTGAADAISPEIAICRAVVRQVMGSTVSVPEMLI